MPRDYDAAPVSAQLGMQNIIAGLVSDLDELRAGKISVNDAIARSLLAKQIFNGVRIYLNGTRLMNQAAGGVKLPETRDAGSVDGRATKADDSNDLNPLPLKGEG